MKARTKAQIEVFNLSKIVLDVADRIKDWAFKECNDYVGLASTNYFWCTSCGKEHSTKLVQYNKVVCPSCKKLLTVEKSRKQSHHQYYYVGFAEVLGNYQVVRLFEVSVISRKHQKATGYVSENVMQFIPSDHSKIQYVARTCYMGNCEPRYGDLEIRKPSMFNERSYNPYPYKFHPWSLFKPEYEKIGINHELQGLTFLSAYRALRFHSKSETLLKAKQYSLFNFSMDSYSRVLDNWSSIRIAMRNKYIVEDAGIWFDYLDLLKFYNKDLCSPKYVCPENLHKEHDKVVDRKTRAEKKLKLKHQMERIKAEQKDYSKRIKDFVGLQFTEGKLTVKVLETIQEFIDEADTHKHCVYSSAYYKKNNSLVFSAMYNGKKVETVELSLSALEIVQSRGLGNRATKHHKSIVGLVNNNLNVIRECYQKTLKTA